MSAILMAAPFFFEIQGIDLEKLTKQVIANHKRDPSISPLVRTLILIKKR